MKINRRNFIKRIFFWSIIVSALSGLGYYYARYIEPNLLTIRKFILENKKIPIAFHNFQIVQFSDTHIGFHYDLKQFEKLVERINEQKPDLILFTGDLVDAPDTYTFTKALPELLNRLHASYGKFWIYGNHDHGGYGTEKIYEVMKSGGFKLLKNSSADIMKEGHSFTLSGLDDAMLGNPDIEKTTKGINKDSFSILMAHEPDRADMYQNYHVDVQLSGHSHGGQVQLPFIGYLITPPMADKYVEGHYNLHRNLHLFVSRGLGTTRLPYRFLCHPEFSVFTLSSPSSNSFVTNNK